MLLNVTNTAKKLMIRIIKTIVAKAGLSIIVRWIFVCRSEKVHKKEKYKVKTYPSS